MERKMYHQSSKAFRHFVTWRQRRRLGKYQYSIYSIVLIVVIAVNHTTASINSEKSRSNNDNSNGIGNGNEHSRRHGHKYSQTIDSLLNSLKNSKNSESEKPSRLLRLPYGNFGESDVCPTCYHVRNSDEIRLEAIKLQILSKLGLKEKPTVTLPVPREILMETLSRAGDHAVGGGEEEVKRKKKKKRRRRKKKRKKKEEEEEEEEQEVEEVEEEEEEEERVKGDEKEEEQKEEEEEEEEEDEDEGLLESEPDDFYGRTSEIITFAQPGNLLNGQTLLEFSHSSESDPGAFISQLRVKSALLWVKVALNRSANNYFPAIGHKNMTLWVFKVKPPTVNTSFLSGKDFDEQTELVGSLSVSLSNVGWQKMEVTGAIREWYGEGNGNKEKLRLLVDCSGCKDSVQVLVFRRSKSMRNLNGFAGRRSRSVGNEPAPERVTSGGEFNEEPARDPAETAKNISSQAEKLDPNRPFLVVHTEPVAMKRSRRRALDCSGAVNGQCCKQNFFVSFKELKWDDWIIAPKGYHANYCRGDCGGMHRTPDTFLNYHTHVIEEYRKMDRLSGIQPCCAPIKFSTMSLIYFGPDNNIIKRDLPKMVVEQCGCP